MALNKEMPGWCSDSFVFLHEVTQSGVKFTAFVAGGFVVVGLVWFGFRNESIST